MATSLSKLWSLEFMRKGPVALSFSSPCVIMLSADRKPQDHRCSIHTLLWMTALVSALMAMSPAEAADAAYAPYVVAVLKKHKLSCSGFLLSKMYVGVGCHCIASLEVNGRPRLTGLKFDDYDFVAGATDPESLRTSRHRRKPKALLTHPWCERQPPVVYDVGIAVMEEPFPTIHDSIEVYDLLSTNAVEFTETLAKMISWTDPKDAPKCQFGGWKILPIAEKNQLMAMDMVTLPLDDCKAKWQAEDPNEHPASFNFTADQLCLVTRDPAKDDTYLPNDGPLVCGRLYVGMVSYGPDRRAKSRTVPAVAQSLAVLVEWMQSDSYFDDIGCFGENADCQKDELNEKGEGNPVVDTMAAFHVISLCLLVSYYLSVG